MAAVDWAAVEALWPDRLQYQFSESQHRRLADYLNTTISDLYNDHDLPERETRALLSSVIASPNMTRTRFAEVAASAYGKALSTAAETAAAEAVVKCWTMTKIRTSGDAGPRAWTGDKTLRDVVEAELESLRPTSQSEGSGIIDHDLNAACLSRYRGVSISWTSNIAQHLELDRRETTITLRVFEHKIWVRNQLLCPGRSLVPREVLRELMLSLNLLFPVAHEPTRALLEERGRMASIYALGGYNYPRPEDLSEFKYWRRNIEVLRSLLNEPQTGLRQLISLDRGNRNLPNFLLFWVSGFVVVVFTLASFGWSVESANVQIDLAKEANELAREANQLANEANTLAREAYDLAVAQACADPDVKGNLPKYCGLSR